jgi:DNA-binding MarR family transcriptional regulator
MYKGDIVKEVYFDTIMLIERLHRLFLDVIKIELDRMRIQDINNVQCLILYNIGKSELTVGEVSNRGYYMGSNVTYNLKKMVENGYIVQEPSPHDRRSSHVRLSEKGLHLFERVDTIITEHTKNISHNGITEQDMRTIKNLLQRLEAFWNFMTIHDIRTYP